MSFKAFSILATLGVATALRPNGTTICDYYTPIVFGKDNSPASQQELMALVTHTFILGNFTTPNVGVKVAGIAGPMSYQDHQINLLPYFTGGYASTNRGGKPTVVNILDDGGATALLAKEPANGTTSNQYRLLTHLYQYFGDFYGCSQQGSDDFPHYQGVASMWEVHKFMDPNLWEVSYFIEQIALAVQSIGMEDPDVEYTKKGLDATFNHACSPPAAVIPASAGPLLQSICSDLNSCPLADNSNCSAYPDNGVLAYPKIVNVTLLANTPKENDTIGLDTASASGSGTAGTSGTATASSSHSASGSATSHSASHSATSTGAASALGAGSPLAVLGAALLLTGLSL